MSIVVRTRGETSAMLPSLLRVSRNVDPAIPDSAAYVMADQLRGLLWQPHIAAVAANAFGLLAVLLATVGIYGAIAFDVSRRIHEIGIRVALGANRRRVARMILSRGAMLGALGVSLGIAGSLAITRVMTGMLYQVSPVDPGIFSTIALVVIALAAIATLIPLRRAVMLDPLEVLRHS
jgi:putative ABC transport system permease protein